MSIITKFDVEGAKLVMKLSTNPKEIANAQKLIKKYKEQEKLRKEK